MRPGLLGIAALLWGSVAHAGSEADALFQEGRDALAKGDLGAACAKFERSAELEPRVGTLLNLAQCEESRGRLLVARERWRAALELAVRTADPREPVARERLAALDKRIPSLSIVLEDAPADARVTCDGRPVAPGEAVLLDPGPHTVVVTVGGRAPSVTTVTLKEAEQRKLSVLVVPHAAPAASSSAPAAPGQGRTLLAASLGGASLVGLGLGAWYGLSAIRNKDDSAPYCDASNACQPTGLGLREDAARDARISTVAFAVGSVALAGAIVVWVTRPTRPVVGVGLGPAGVSLGGAF